MSNWRDLAVSVDEAIDNVFGDPVVLIPWIKRDYSSGEQDGDRDSLTAVAVVEIHDGKQVAVTKNGAASDVVADVVMSIRREPVDQIGLRKFDRVEWFGVTYEVCHVEPGDSDRPNVYLNRVLD